MLKRRLNTLYPVATLAALILKADKLHTFRIFYKKGLLFLLLRLLYMYKKIISVIKALVLPSTRLVIYIASII